MSGSMGEAGVALTSSEIVLSPIIIDWNVLKTFTWPLLSDFFDRTVIISESVIDKTLSLVISNSRGPRTYFCSVAWVERESIQSHHRAGVLSLSPVLINYKHLLENSLNQFTANINQINTEE